jgi:transcription-repair coupling factor (superfamily II helicase)
VRSEPELQKVIEEVRDRYGPPPPSIENLAEYAFIRVLADRIGIESIDREGQLVVLKFRPEAKLDPTWLFKIVQERKDLQLAPPATLRLDMKVAGKTGAGRSRSWWTARATAGEVTGGFTKDEILRPAKEDPRAEGGVFSRVSGLLRDLSEGVRIR